jgi:hypothetical protein
MREKNGVFGETNVIQIGGDQDYVFRHGGEAGDTVGELDGG